ncbi:MAG TPA: YihY/virulence factor BrkB family protein [Dongiaceae bacterium]|nr:YihY/virulence factor BrkB family protein [Dongiaceae bacterium]
MRSRGSGSRRTQRLTAWGSLRAAGETIWEAVVNLIRHEGLELSGYMSFMSILALFPFLIFVVAIAGFIGQAEGAGKFINMTFEFLPPEVTSVLGPTIANIITHPRGDLLTFGILFAIWSASSGVEALRLLLNRCYGVPETRSVFLLRLQSVVLVVLSAIAIAIMSLAIVLAPVIERLLAHYHFEILLDRNAWFRIRYGAVIPTTTIVLIALHLFLPNRPPRLGEIWPGTLITAVLWITGAAGFSIYVDNLASYNVTYGSLGGIVLSLLFFYVAAIIFGFGAEMNAAIMRRLSPIAPAPVGDMRHAIEPSAGHRQPADSVLTGDQMAGKPREPGT